MKTNGTGMITMMHRNRMTKKMSQRSSSARLTWSLPRRLSLFAKRTGFHEMEVQERWRIAGTLF